MLRTLLSEQFCILISHSSAVMLVHGRLHGICRVFVIFVSSGTKCCWWVSLFDSRSWKMENVICELGDFSITWTPFKAITNHEVSFSMPVVRSYCKYGPFTYGLHRGLVYTKANCRSERTLNTGPEPGLFSLWQFIRLCSASSSKASASIVCYLYPFKCRGRWVQQILCSEIKERSSSSV